MVKLEQNSGGSVDDITNRDASCSVEASPETAKTNGSVSKSSVNGSSSAQFSVKETSLSNGWNKKLATEETSLVNGWNKVAAKETTAVNGWNKIAAKETTAVNGWKETTTVNGCNKVPENVSNENKAHVKENSTVHEHYDKLSEKNVATTVIPYNKVVVNGIATVHGNCNGEVPAEIVPMVNEKCDLNKDIGNICSGSNTPSENGSVQTVDSLYNEDNIDNDGFTLVERPRRKSQKNNTNYRKKPNFNLPPARNTESIRHDKSDKNCTEKKTSSPTNLSQKPPSRNLAAIRCSTKSYSSVLANGQNGDSQISNGSPTPSNTQNVTKSNKILTNNSTVPESQMSVDRLSTDLTKSSVIKDSAVACEQCKSAPKIEMTDVSAQTDVCSPTELSSSHKESLPSFDEIDEPEKCRSPSDYVDNGEISDGSSNVAYCDSVVSNDSGRGDGEIVYDSANPYCCEFPKEKTSQLIGKGGSFRYEIEKKSGVVFWVHPHIADKDLNMIHMMGTGAQIEEAKTLIRGRFRHVKLRQWIGSNPMTPQLSDDYAARLSEGTDFPGVVSSICNPNYFWVQPFGHPNYYVLQDLERRVSDHFNTVFDAPRVENPQPGSVVAVPGAIINDSVVWLRGSVIELIQVEGEEDLAVVRYLDWGGEYRVPVSSLRPMRHDFLLMPFFASQCCLYDINPKGGAWSEEALAEFTRLCNGSSNPPIIRVMLKTPDVYYVTMFGYDPELNAQVDIAARLISKGFGVRPSVPAAEFPTEFQH